MQDAVEGITKIFGMAVCDKSNVVNVTEKVHNLLLCGMFATSDTAMSRAIIGFNTEYGCVLKVCIRSTSKTISTAISECV